MPLIPGDTDLISILKKTVDLVRPPNGIIKTGQAQYIKEIYWRHLKLKYFIFKNCL